jgi:8-oxo-dGTP diphosphatase
LRSFEKQENMHIVIGIIKNSNKEVLVSRRKSDAHLGGLLEFPGGKVEKNESPVAALRREIKEELNIDVVNATPLIQIPYSYSDRNILLDAYLIDEYSGSVSGYERQEIFWKKIEVLNYDKFPDANFGVIRALQLPKIFPVTPNFSEDSEKYLTNFEEVASNQSTHIIQLRSHDLGLLDYIKLAKQCADICRRCSVKLILNREVGAIHELLAAGVHLTSDKLLNTTMRPLDENYLVGASCHNLEEIVHANSLRLDYIFIGPVVEKNNNSSCVKLNWDGFSNLSIKSLIPVYAIGGLGVDDLNISTRHGGQGVAAIRYFWDTGA